VRWNRVVPPPLHGTHFPIKPLVRDESRVGTASHWSLPACRACKATASFLTCPVRASVHLPGCEPVRRHNCPCTLLEVHCRPACGGAKPAATVPQPWLLTASVCRAPRPVLAETEATCYFLETKWPAPTFHFCQNPPFLPSSVKLSTSPTATPQTRLIC
jgi:hypothetical protein